MELNLTPLNLTGNPEDEKRPVIIAGPCSAETEEQVMTTATQLARKGVKLFRAGIWKPRTKPGGFEGIGEEGLTWLQRVQQELGMKVCTEVATHAHVEAALNAGIDALWIGARTVANPFAMQEIADRYPSDTEYLFPFITSDNKVKASRDVRRVRENVVNAFKQIAVRCNLSVVPSMYMVKDIYQRLIERVSVSTII